MSRPDADHAAADLTAVVDEMLTPQRRAEHPSRTRWDERTEIAGPTGPLILWSRGRGPVVLLVHGWEATHTDLDAFVEPLLAGGFRVVTLDLPAHGESAGTTATIPELAAGLLAPGASTGPLAALIAHSVGCAASVRAIRRGLVVERLVLVSSPERYVHYVQSFARAKGLEPQPLMQALAERGLDVAALDVVADAGALDHPVLIVHSADDRVVADAGARRIAAAWRGSTLHIVDGLGHMRILRDASVVAAAVAFTLRAQAGGDGR